MAERIYETLTTAVLGWLAREEALDGTRRRPDESDPARGVSRVVLVARDELHSPGDERFEFLIHSLLAGMPDPPTVSTDAEDDVVDVRDELPVPSGMTTRA
jgi:hypothetical protein